MEVFCLLEKCSVLIIVQSNVKEANKAGLTIIDNTILNNRAFNIFQVYQYFTIYRRYFLLKFEQFHEYLIQHSLKSGGTKDHFRWVKVPGTTPN